MCTIDIVSNLLVGVGYYMNVVVHKLVNVGENEE